MDSHDNEEAMSMYLVPVRVCPYFFYTFGSKRNTVIFENSLPVRRAMVNKPEGLLDSEFTKRGRIRHHFYAMSSVT
jgi:hypothetical protein